MLPRKPPKRLFKNAEVISTYKNDRSPRSRRAHMVREHGDVLQNIESGLVSTARQMRGIDDRMIEQALRVCIDQAELPDDCDIQVSALCSRLESVRSFRGDISDQIWVEGLRTIHDSVKLHSSLVPGDRSYLDFVSPYV